MGETQESEKRRTYLEERKLSIEAERESARSFDRAMVTLSSGALALSITFIRQIAPAPRFETYLYLAWTGFIVALLCTLLSFLCSQSALRRQRDILDRIYEGSQHVGEQKTRMATITHSLNWASILFFILGVAFLTFFAMKNLPLELPLEEEAMSEKQSKPTQPSQDVEKKGFVPPKPPVEKPSDKPQPPPGTSQPEKR